MTSTEMRDLLFLKFDSLYENTAPDYDDTQISPILSNAQRRIVRKIDKGIDYNERAKKYLAPLYGANSTGTGGVVISTIQTDAFPNGTIYDLPADLWYITTESATLTGAASASFVKAKTLDYYAANVSNPYQQPDANIIWRFERDNVATGEPRAGQKRVELVTDGSASISSYSIRYMAEIPDIVIGSVDSILHEDLHDDIVDEAYKIMVGAVKPEEYQIANNESLNS